ncbi:hypothetical protein [Dehalococcoides mccartyi]|uniref:C2H2-type domain-containing protein n=1 Tax=Dehalococcoides mccartyi (strain CBDB1) TaxID=255470 RepID=A0A916KM82_DEHMC|nr:hypothetical protein [Dehalococcoides mccartyi]CAI82868.1 hypothetical protein cbdbA706 [Dehalococcoides mccartyi CBDB1]
MYTCSVCGKTLKLKRSLDRHMTQFHSLAAPATDPNPEPEAIPEAIPEAAELKIQAPPKRDYYCIDCGYSPIRKGTTACPKCGGAFDWGAIE